MKLLLLAALFPLLAQTPSQITMTPTNGSPAATIDIEILPARVSIMSKVCDGPVNPLTNKPTIAPAETMSCIVMLNRAALPGGFESKMTYPAPLTGPPTIVVPEGSNAVRFQVSDPPPPSP